MQIIAFYFLVAAITALFRDEDELHLRFESEVCSGVGGALQMFLVKLLLLPFESWVSLSAAVTALWRMGFSRRKLLEWTPASAFEGRQHGVPRYYLAMWPCVAVGAAVCFAKCPFAWAAGLLWLLAPWFAFLLSRMIVRDVPVSSADRGYLLTCAKRIWAFFTDFCTPKDNFLPPDN